jgi:chromosome segregation ATPase
LDVSFDALGGVKQCCDEPRARSKLAAPTTAVKVGKSAQQQQRHRPHPAQMVSERAPELEEELGVVRRQLAQYKARYNAAQQEVGEMEGQLAAQRAQVVRLKHQLALTAPFAQGKQCSREGHV